MASSAPGHVSDAGRPAAARLGELVAGTGAVWVAVVALYLVSALISPAMLQVAHVLNMLQVAAFVGVIACGQTIVLLIGGIDLSQAGTVTLINIVSTAIMLGHDGDIAPAILVCLLLALVVGLGNAVLIVVFRVTPLIATLSTNSILFGAALVFTGGAPHGSAAPAFNWIGQGNIFGFPASTLVWIVIAAVLAWVTKATVYGRWLFATGANPVAARLMGVPVKTVQASAYVVSALSATLGSLLLTAYVGTPSLGIGNQFLFSSVAAAVVGGTALTGGVGSVLATVGGAIFITELDSFTNIIQINTGTQMVLQGAIIAASVLLYRTIARKRR
jgi:ribose/xylose/arabinose/galactoside ABC-type transport system permease subunit